MPSVVVYLSQLTVQTQQPHREKALSDTLESEYFNLTELKATWSVFIFRLVSFLIC